VPSWSSSNTATAPGLLSAKVGGGCKIAVMLYRCATGESIEMVIGPPASRFCTMRTIVGAELVEEQKLYTPAPE